MIKTYHSEANTDGITQIALKFFGLFLDKKDSQNCKILTFKWNLSSTTGAGCPPLLLQMPFMDAQPAFGQCVRAHEKYFSCMHESHTKTSYLEICFYLKEFRTYFCKFTVKQGTDWWNTSHLVRKYWLILSWTKS